MLKKVIVASLALVVTLSVASCSGGEAGLPSAEEIIEGTVEALEHIRTYQFEADMTMSMTAEAEGETFKATIAIDMSGALDTDNEEMKADIDISMEVPEEDEIDMRMAMYIVDDMMYASVETPLLGDIPMWVKSEVPEGIMDQLGQVDSQVELLETAQVKVIGSEKVKGVDCYVLDLTPDMERLWELAMQQSQVSGEALPDIAKGFIGEMFSGFSVKYWIAKDTYFLAKAEIDMALELTPEALGFPDEEGSLTMDIAMTLLAYDYNQPVSIELPPEAEDAVEAPVGELFP